MAQRLTIRMNRANSGQSWGFRLNGGMEYGLPMTILTIVRNSVCDRCGLRPRDRVVQINNMNVDGATHQQTKMEIIRSGLEMDMVVYRDPPGTNPVQMAPAGQPPAPEPQNNGYLQGYGPVLAPVTKPTSQPAPAPAAAPAPAPAPEPTPAPAPAPAPVPALAPEPTPAPAPAPDAAPVQEAPTTETDAPPAKPTEEAAPAPPPEEAPKEEPAPASSETKADEPVVNIAPLTVETDIDVPADTEVLSPKEVLASPAFKEMSTKGSKPFSPGGVKKAIPNVTHSKYNSPMGLYSADNIASVYAAQTEGIEREMESVDVSKAPVGTKMTGALQVID